MSARKDRPMSRVLRSPDTELLDLLREAEVAEWATAKAEAAWHQLDTGEPGHEAAQRRAYAADQAFRLVLDRVCALPARTEQGKAAKARLMQILNVHVLPDGSLDQEASAFMRVAHSLSLDLAGPLLR